MFDSLLSWFAPPVQLDPGANFDNRSLSEKEKDTKFEETVSTANVDRVNWVEKKESEWRKFPIFDQNGSGSCVAQTAAKMLGINYFINEGSYVHFSATDIYQQRSNRPSGGMIGVEGLRLAGQGVTLEDLAPSQNLKDSQMDNYLIAPYKHKVGDVFKVDGEPVVLPTRDIDTIASVIQRTQKGVMVWFYFERREWTDEPRVRNTNLTLTGSSTVRHSVTAVDFFKIDGKRYLLIEDSWGPEYGKGGRRLISEDFFAARNWFAGYIMNFKFDDSKDDNKPRHAFPNDLKYSPVVHYGNADVIALQDILKYEGLFPKNIESTGWYGSVTADAVLKFQLKYKVAPEAELRELAGKVVGPKTREALNQLYGR